MTDAQELWLVEAPPATEEPEVLRAYIRDLRAIRPQTSAVATLIATAEDILADLERERAQAAA